MYRLYAATATPHGTGGVCARVRKPEEPDADDTVDATITRDAQDLDTPAATGTAQGTATATASTKRTTTRRAQEEKRKAFARKEKLAKAEDPLAPLKKMFNAFDQNHDGTVSWEELTTSLEALGRKPTDSQLDEMIARVGGHHDRINFEEFCKFMAIHADYLAYVDHAREAEEAQAYDRAQQKRAAR